jgi:hypothetical protein
MLAQPLEADYEIEVFDGGVRVTFRPTCESKCQGFDSLPSYLPVSPA